MSVAVLLPSVICAAFLVAVALVVHLLARAESALPVTAEWIGELSTDRYLPMARLLNFDDIAFLRAQPGFAPEMEYRLRLQRCQLFRGYLRCLNSDFKRVATALKVLLTQSQHDRPDLAAALVQHQIRFAATMLNVRARLFLFQYGVGTVEVDALLRIFDAMRVELGALVPASSEACA
jgi:hypothetical protein